MQVSEPFKLYYDVPESLLELLNGNCLGSNGARYLHLDIKEKLANLECPVHLCLERNGKIIANVTLDKREIGWYVRYFAFGNIFKSDSERKKTVNNKNSILKTRLLEFFDSLLADVNSEQNLIYAYIDPTNFASKWFAEEMGFDKVATVKTQTFSRNRPKIKLKIEPSSTREQNGIYNTLAQLFYPYNKDNMALNYSVNNGGKNKISCSVYLAHWKIEALPGKYGVFSKSVLPYLPFLRKLIRPNNHKFLVIEDLNYDNGCEHLVGDFLESILATHKLNLAIWWVDVHNPFSKKLENVKWGLLHMILGVSKVDLCIKSTIDHGEKNKDSYYYVSGYDLM